MGSLREQILLLISTPLYLAVIGLEIVLSHLKQQRSYSWRDTLTNIYLMLVNSGIDLTFRVAYLWVLAFFFRHRPFTWQAGVAYWVVLLVSEDFMYYWLHRIDHYCRFFWAVHVTHHSSHHFNFSVGFRSSVFEPLYRFIFFIPIAWAGFAPVDIAFMYSATQIWGILVHTEKIGRLGWLEYFLVTPSHHKIHHASNPRYLDRNLGMFLIIWDRLFGTYKAEDDHYQKIKYGLTKDLENPGPVGIIFHEWQAIARDLNRPGLTWRQRWRYLFGPPGWSHDGSRLTSRQLREQEDA